MILKKPKSGEDQQWQFLVKNCSICIFFIPATLRLIASQIKPLQVLPTFDFLYFFENKQIIILELKRTDLPCEAIKSDIYKWLMIDRDTTMIIPLDFLSMQSGEHQQERFFRQGYLSFDSDLAIYIRESSSIQNILRNKEIQQIPQEIALLIHKELSPQRR